LNPAPGADAMFLIKPALFLFLLFWCGLGIWLFVKYEKLFGLHPDDPAESSGARALNVTQVSIVWVGVFKITLYFLIS
jgi:hypothetical protein